MSILRLIVVAAVFAGSPSGRAQGTAADPLSTARAALVRGDVDSALAVLAPLVAGEADRAALELAVAAHEAKGEFGIALERVDRAGTGATGIDATRLAFVRARLLLALGRKDEAHATTRTAVDALRDPARRFELARTWLDLARERTEAPANATPTERAAFVPDYEAARPLLEAALETGALGAETARTRLALARALDAVAADATRRETLALEALGSESSLSPEEQAEAWHRVARARVHLGDVAALAAARTVVAIGKRPDLARALWLEIGQTALNGGFAAARDTVAIALEAIERLAALEPAGAEAESMRRALAENLAAEPGTAGAALVLLEAARAARPQSPEAATIELRIADLRTRTESRLAALPRLEAFLAGRAIDEGWRLVSQRIEGLLLEEAAALTSSASRLDGAGKRETAARARDAWKRYLEKYPAHENLPATLLAISRVEREAGDPDAAAARVEALRAGFPGRAEAQWAIVDSARDLVDRKQDYAGAFALLVTVPADSAARAAADQLRRAITEPKVAFSPLPVLAGGTVPKLALEAANVDVIDVAIYRIDLREFFLATGEIDPLTRIDVSLIAPDEKRSLPKVEAAPHTRTTHTIELPALQSGEARIVAARAGDLEARALVVASDLAAAVVRTATELRVFGVDRKTGAVVNEVELRVALDGKLVPKADTAKASWTSSQLAILASTATGLAPIADDAIRVENVVLAPRGSLVVDRSSARPGDSIGVTGFAADARGVTLAAARLRVYEPNSGSESTAEVPLTIGTGGRFHGRWSIDSGLWVAADRRFELRLEVPSETVAAGTTVLATTSVTVGAFLDATRTIRFEPAGAPPRAGEPAHVFVRVTDRDGVARAGIDVEWRLGRGAPRHSTTDADGRCAVEIPATETIDRAYYELEATADGVSEGHRGYLISAGRTLRVDVPDAPLTLVTGDSLELDLELRDGTAPFAGKIGWTLARHKGDESSAVGSGAIETLADGRARLAVQFAATGSHTLNLTYTDANGLERRVSRDVEVLASSDLDPRDFALLPPRRAPLRGEDYELRVLWPYAAGPALVVQHGAALDRAEIRRFEKGINSIAMTASPDLAREVEILVVPLEAKESARTRIALGDPLTARITAPTRTVETTGTWSAAVRVERGEEGRAAHVHVIVTNPESATRIAATLRAGITGAKTVLPRTPVVALSSGPFTPAVDTLLIDPSVGDALLDLDAAKSFAADPMVDSLALDELVALRRIPGAPETEADAPEQLAGSGGPTPGGTGRAQGGASYAGKFGGRNAAKTLIDDPPVATFEDVATDASGNLQLPILVPRRPGKYAIVVFAVDATGAGAVATHEFVHDPPLVADLAISDGPATPPRRALLRVARRDDANAPLTVDVAAPRGAAPLSRRSLEVAPRSAVATTLDLPEGDGGEVTIAETLTLPFSAPPALASRDELTIAWQRALTIPAARRAALGSTPLEIYASPVAALAAHRTTAEPTDLEAVTWHLFATAKAVLLAQGLPADRSDAAALETLRRDTRAAVERFLAILPPPAARDEFERIGPAVALALLAFDAARDAGLATGARADATLGALLAATEATLVKNPTPQRRALPILALAAAEAASFERVNRLLRDAGQLGPRELAMLVLTLRDTHRASEAAQVQAQLATAIVDGDAATRALVPAAEPLGSESEVAALIALAAADSDANARALAARWLGTIALDSAGGAAPLALLALASNTGDSAIALRYSNFERRLEFAPAGALGVARLELPSLGLPEGDLALDPGSTLLLARVGGAPRRTATVIGPSATRSIQRHIARRGSLEVETGSQRVGPRDPAVAESVTRLGIDRRYRVSATILLDPAAPRSFWWFESALPGCTPVVGSWRAGSLRVPTADGTWIRFDDVAPEQREIAFSYEIMTREPGAFAAAPNVVRSARAGNDVAVSGAELAYTIENAEVDASLTASPNESLAVGLAAAGSQDHATVLARLGPLLDRLLEDDAVDATRRAVLRALLLAALAGTNDGEIVRYFEIAKERDPDHVLSFDEMDRVARAYAAIGELERAKQVLAAIGDSLFLQEARVIGRLELASKELRELTLVERLLAEYDVTPTTLETAFAFGQHAASLAAAAPLVAGTDPEKLSRGAWLAAGRRALERHLVLAPRDAATEEVTLTLANLLLSASQPDDAITLAEAATTRFTAGRFTATWPYIRAFASFLKRDLAETKRHAAALIGAAERSVDPAQQVLARTGKHMLAQAWHAEGDLAKAREYYEQVKDVIPDARLVLEQLDRTALTVPPLVQGAAGAELVVPLDRKGTTGDVEVLLYAVDLRLLYLKERGFDTLADLELAGVMPTRRESMSPTRDPVTRGERVSVAAPGVGAYLVALRCGDLHARTIAIVSDLSLEVIPLPGAARVLATDRATGQPRPDVVVTFVGSASEKFVTGKTDLRGIAAAEKLAGVIAVIAEKDGHYAFFQGTEDVPAPVAAEPTQSSQSADDLGLNKAEEQLEENRQRYRDVWNYNTNRAQRGVEIRRTKQ